MAHLKMRNFKSILDQNRFWYFNFLYFFPLFKMEEKKDKKNPVVVQNRIDLKFTIKIAHNIVFNLLTLLQHKLLLLISLLHFCIYFFYTLVHGFFSVFLPIKLLLLKTIAKSKEKLITIAFKSKKEWQLTRKEMN